MGYRSDVRIIVSKDGLKELRRVVKEEAMKYATPDYDYNLLNSAKFMYHFDGSQVMICWDSIKWYDGSYKDVDAVMHGLNHLTEVGFNWRFSRIGEELDDIEERYYDNGKEDVDLEYPCISRYFDDYNIGFEERNDLNV